jgi:hypothetical protein
MPDQHGRTSVVTEANDGLGLETARQLDQILHIADGVAQQIAQFGPAPAPRVRPPDADQIGGYLRGCPSDCR